MCMSLDKIIEWFFLQFIFYILQMTQTQEIITHRVLKFTNGYEGMCMTGEKFIKEWQMKDKITGSIFPNLHSTIYKWLKLKNNNS